MIVVDRRRAFRSRLGSFALWLAVAAVLLSPWLFGSSDPWAYLFLCLVILAAVLLWLLSIGHAPPLHFGVGPVLWSCVALGVLFILQVAPWPGALVRAVSPLAHEAQTVRDAVLVRAGMAEAAEAAGWMPLSLCVPGTVHELCRFAACVAVFVMVVHGFEGWQQLRRVAGVVAVAGFVLALFAIVRRTSGVSELYWYHRDSAQGAVTSFGTFANRNHFAAHMNMLFGITIGLLLAENTLVDWGRLKGWRARAAWLATPEGGVMALLTFAAAVMALSMCLSLSRAGVASLLAGLAVATWLWPRAVFTSRRAWVVIAVVIVLVAAGLVWLGWGAMARRLGALAGMAGDPFSNSRTVAYRDAWRMYLSFPLLGCGFGSFQHVFPTFQSQRLLGWRWTHLHNDYLEILAEGGLVGFALWAGIGIMCWRLIAGWHGRMEPERAAFVRGLAVGVIAVALHSVVDFSLHRFANALLLTVVGGLAAGAVTRPDETERLPYATPAAWGPLRPQLLTVAAAVFLCVLMARMVNDLKGELAYARFRQWDVLREKQVDVADAVSFAEDVEAEAQNVIRAGRHNPDNLIEVAVRLIRWLPNEQIDPALRIRFARQAERAAAGAVHAAPSNYEYWLWLARVKALLGEEDKAQVLLQRARELAPRDKVLKLTR
ncbi:MAG: O-antigen ligase family protein [Phycisphaerae bacterium]|nr:O-antigen ligase family protein [Phycisphaerae bacterium]